MKSRVLYSIRGIRCWQDMTPSAVKFGSYVGEMIISDSAFIFLSTGSTEFLTYDWLVESQSEKPKGIFINTNDPVVAKRLKNKGSFITPFSKITSVIAKRRWDFGTYVSICVEKKSKTWYAFQERGFSCLSMKNPLYIQNLVRFRISKT